jgi:hypothetical protein
MKLEDLMKSHQGEWQGDVAVVQIDGYYWRVATRNQGRVELTVDGRNWLTRLAPKATPKVGKKAPVEPEAASAAVPEELSVAPATVDDLEL